MNAKRPSFVALMDILGYRDLCETTDPKELLVLMRRFQAKPVLPHVEAIQFSDTILLFTEGDNVSKFYNLVGEASAIIGEALDAGIGIRAGVTRGPFVHDAGKRAFAGRALVRAHELEQAQDWIGGIVDPRLERDSEVAAALEDLATDGFVFRYPAPLRGGPVGPLWCLGWPLNTRVGVNDVETIGAEKANWGVMRKLANSRAFMQSWTQAMSRRDANKSLPDRKFFPEDDRGRKR